MGFIYLITNNLNGKKYVGQTIAQDINKRWKSYYNLRKKQIGICFYNALNKHKPENFKFEIICICFDDDCNKYEEDYIQKFDTLSPNGYNLRLGGKNGKQHPESIEKRRIANTGKKRQEEHILRGERNHNFGVKMSEEQKQKISKSFTIERKEKLSNIMIEKHKNGKYKNIKKNLEGLKNGAKSLRKKVNCYSINNELIKTYDSMSEASKDTNTTHQAISKCCSGKYKNYKTAGGFIWKLCN